MNRLLPKYIRRKFTGLFLLCLISVIVIFLIVDMVENMDQFIDKKVPKPVVALYYIYYIPYIVILTIPIGTLLAVVFSVGTMARNNEIIAFKSLGYSLYQVLQTLLSMGFLIAFLSFGFTEGLASYTTKKKVEIERDYLGKVKSSQGKRLRNLEIQDPPNRMITIGLYDVEGQIAQRVNIFTFDGYKLQSRLDVNRMRWNTDHWILEGGYRRVFSGENEHAELLSEPESAPFTFRPEALSAVRIKPDEMGLMELIHLMKRVRLSGGEVHRWLTDIHLRFAFPASNIVIILLSVPLVYNRRKKSLVTGFGISLAICFLFFGFIKVGQTMGQNGSIPPILAAWMGNGIMVLVGGIDLLKTRK